MANPPGGLAIRAYASYILSMADDEKAKKKPGPREKLLVAGKKLFMEKGFSEVSTEEICRVASVSKASLYRYFDDMSDLLEAVVTLELENQLPPYRDMPSSREELIAALRGIATDISRILSNQDILDLDRMVFESARQHPEIAEIYNHIALHLFHQHIGDLLKHGHDHQQIELPADPYDLADNLIAMWDGLGLMRVRLGLQEKPYDDMDAWFQKCLTVLLRLE